MLQNLERSRRLDAERNCHAENTGKKSVTSWAWVSEKPDTQAITSLAWVSGFSGGGGGEEGEERKGKREEKPDTKALRWVFRPLDEHDASP